MINVLSVFYIMTSYNDNSSEGKIIFEGVLAFENCGSNITSSEALNVFTVKTFCRVLFSAATGKCTQTTPMHH